MLFIAALIKILFLSLRVIMDTIILLTLNAICQDIFFSKTTGTNLQLDRLILTNGIERKIIQHFIKDSEDRR